MFCYFVGLLVKLCVCPPGCKHANYGVCVSVFMCCTQVCLVHVGLSCACCARLPGTFKVFACQLLFSAVHAVVEGGHLFICRCFL